jgi:hypothetical protein
VTLFLTSSFSKLGLSGLASAQAVARQDARKRCTREPLLTGNGPQHGRLPGIHTAYLAGMQAAFVHCCLVVMLRADAVLRWSVVVQQGVLGQPELHAVLDDG